VLAYVFWHWPHAGFDREGYEGALKRYHALLAEAGAEGFHMSVSFVVEGAPWLPEATAYEDWYLVEASFALDALNEVAVSGRLRAPHDEAARGVEGMAAGLYRLRSGDPKLAEAGDSLWLTKGPASYQEFDRELAGWTVRPNVSLWRRQMVLGPTPEFCLLGPDELIPPSRFTPVRVRRQRLWPEFTGQPSSL
jgi:hypothetical protein